MLKETIAVGAPALFWGIQCKVSAVQSDNRLRLTIPSDLQAVHMPPLFVQDICWIQSQKKLYWCVGEVLERYHSENALMLELEIKSGLCEMKNHTVIVRSCCIDAMLSVEGGKWQQVTVTAFSTAEALLKPPECGLLKAADLQEEKTAALKLSGMQLCGSISAAEDAQAAAYEMRFQYQNIETQSELMEKMIFGTF